MTPVTACERINQERPKIELKIKHYEDTWETRSGKKTEFLLILKIMKKIGKLLISKEKTLRQDELLTLRGGDYFYCFLCICPGGSPAKYEWADAAHQARSFGSEWCWDQAEYQLCIWEQDTTWCGPQ
ncbi:MAG: hypothetical protein KBA50_09790 [Sedimentibacter sp.]|nr:hypothetical protein [Sedimentibacter sp.]